MFKRRLLPTLLGLVLVGLLGLIRLGDPVPVAAIRDMGFDFYQRLMPRAGADSPVRVVDIDDASLARLGQWPWPRSMLATLTERLSELGVAAIGYDVLFPLDAMHTFDLAGPFGCSATAEQLTRATAVSLHGGRFARVVTTGDVLAGVR